MKLKHLTSLLLITGFIALSIFGITIINHQSDHPDSDCPAYAINGAVCPTNIMEFVRHHLASLQVFSNTLTAPAFGLFFASIFLSFILISIFFLPQTRLRLKFKTDCRLLRITRWLALFEHSPTFN